MDGKRRASRRRRIWVGGWVASFAFLFHSHGNVSSSLVWEVGGWLCLSLPLPSPPLSIILSDALATGRRRCVDWRKGRGRGRGLCWGTGRGRGALLAAGGGERPIYTTQTRARQLGGGSLTHPSTFKATQSIPSRRRREKPTHQTLSLCLTHTLKKRRTNPIRQEASSLPTPPPSSFLPYTQSTKQQPFLLLLLLYLLASSRSFFV